MIIGFGLPVYNVTQVSYRQAITPERLQGRMNSVMRFIVWGVIPLGNASRGRDRVDDRPARRDLGRGDRHVARRPAGAAVSRAHAARRCLSQPTTCWRRSRATAVGSLPGQMPVVEDGLVKQRSPLLQRSGFFALLSAEIISSLGSQMTFLALPWFVLTTTGSTTRMGIVLAAELLPMALLGIPSGVVVTRLGARRTMLVSRSLPRAADGVDTDPLLGGVAQLPACCSCSCSCSASSSRRTSPRSGSSCPSSSATIRPSLTQANAVVEAGSRLTILLGPITAGLLIAWIGATNVLYVDAATYAVSFLLLFSFVPQAPAASGPRKATVAFSPACASSSATRCCARCSLRSSSCTCSRRRSSSRCRCSRTATSTRARARPGS